MFDTPVQMAGALLTVLVTAAALRLGGRPERIVALASLAAYLLSPAAQFLQGPLGPQGALWGVAVIDVALFSLLVHLTLTQPRLWLPLAAGVELATALAHLGRLLDPNLLPRGYVTSLWVFYFLFLGTIVLGLFEVRRRRRLGFEG